MGMIEQKQKAAPMNQKFPFQKPQEGSDDFACASEPTSGGLDPPVGATRPYRQAALDSSRLRCANSFDLVARTVSNGCVVLSIVSRAHNARKDRAPFLFFFSASNRIHEKDQIQLVSIRN